MKRKIESCRAMLHGVRPGLDKLDVAVGKFRYRKFVRNGPVGEQSLNEDRGHALRIIEPVALQIERSSQPIRGIEQSVAAMIFGHSINRSQIAAELKLVAENAGVLGNVRVKIARAFRKSAAAHPSDGANVFEI